MKLVKIIALATLFSVALFCTACSSNMTPSTERSVMSEKAYSSLMKLYRETPSAKVLGDKARAVLVFPDIVKGGFIAGGQYGKGTLFVNGRSAGYYSSLAASYGLQAGLQEFGYALFFMSDADLQYLNASDGWEVGVGPTITIVDKGMANSFTTTTSRSGVYAFFFDQKGLMAGLGIQGTKITKLNL